MTGRSPPTFDLVAQPWVPVEDLAGRVRTVGLAEVFERATELRRVLDASPLVTASLYRMLFAIFHRAVPIPGHDEWIDAWDAGWDAAPTSAYLARWRHRFDLFEPTAPFWQVADMDESHGSMAWTKLAAELNDNNSKVLFDHTATGRAVPAEPATVARYLVACQVMSVGAGKSSVGYNVHAPTATALVVVPEGRTLADTFLANVRMASGLADLPVWERPPMTVAAIVAANLATPPVERLFSGIADRLTWRTRAIRIVPPVDDEGVRYVRFGAGERVAAVDGDRDPWVPYGVTKEGAWTPRRWRTERAIWRDLQAIVVSEAGSSEAPRVLSELGRLVNADRAVPSWTLLLAGQAADKAKIEAWGQERWVVPSRLIEGVSGAVHAVKRAMRAANGTAAFLERLQWRLARDLLGVGAAPAKSDVASAAARLPAVASYWSLLERSFARFLRDLTDSDGEAGVAVALAGWNEALAAAVAKAAADTHATLGRDAIAIRAWARTSPRFEALEGRLRRDAARQQGGAT